MVKAGPGAGAAHCPCPGDARVELTPRGAIATLDRGKYVSRRPDSLKKRTILSVLKSYYDEEIFTLLIRELYSEDLEVSLAAIDCSASLGNETAVPHLYRLLEAGVPEQKLAAARALAAIRAPSSVGHIIRYFTLLGETVLKRELLSAANLVAANDVAVQEMDRNVLQAPSTDELLAAEAFTGLMDSGRVDLVRPYIASAPPTVQLAALRRLVQSERGSSPGLLEALRDRLDSLGPQVLGRTLAALAVRDLPARHAQVLEKLRQAPSEATRAFLDGLAEAPAPLPHPRHLFRLALVVPHVDAQAEAAVGSCLERIVREATTAQSTPLPYFWLTVSTHIDSVFARIRRDFPSIRGVKARGSLLIVILAKLIERYASPLLLQRIQAHFQGSLLSDAGDLAAELAGAMADAPDEDRNQLRATAPLFATRSAKLRILVSSQLASINLDRPDLIRRLNRLVRTAGRLRARRAAPRVCEVLEFAREERISFLEETCVVTLCQLAHRPTLEALRATLAEPARGLPTVNGYARGARWLAARPLLPTMTRLLATPQLSSYTRSLILETLESWDLSQEPAAVGPLLGVLEGGPLTDAEAQRLAALLARSASPANAVMFIDLSRRSDPIMKRTAARALRGIADRVDATLHDLLANALYSLLDSGDTEVEVLALLGLVRQGDDYARQVFSGNLRRSDEDYLVAILRELSDEVEPETVPALLALLEMPSASVHERLRETLGRLAAGTCGEQIRAGLIGGLKETAQPVPAQAAATVEGLALAERAKSEFRFRRENSQILTVLFVDVVGYTERTSDSDTTSLLNLIQAFEDIVLPQVDAYDGRIIKKLGDGILAAFKHPLKATLAAVAIQARIRAHNEYRVEGERLRVRVGVNTGLVVRKGGDIYGDVVNVAARMQAAANPGEILLTHATYSEIRDHVVCTPLGGIQVKGKREPIMAYSATEVLGGNEGMMGSLDAGTERQLAELNLTETIVKPAFVFPEGAPVEDHVGRTLSGIFEDITRASEELTRDYHQENAFKRYLQEKWDELVHRIVGDRRRASL